MTALYLTIGAPASGKSTWAQAFAARNGLEVVERDSIREEVARQDNIVPHDKNWGKTHEERTTKLQKDRIIQFLKMDVGVIISDTNLNPNTREAFDSIALNFGVPCYNIHFFESRETLHVRNKDREGWKVVPEEVVDNFYRRHVEMAPFNPDEYYDVGYFEDDEPVIANMPRKENYRGLAPMAVVFDLDGTLALHRGRSPYEEMKADTDAVNGPVSTVLRMYRQSGFYILLVSGRSESSKHVTERWLENYRIPYDGLYMRKAGDNIKDNIVKHDIYAYDIYPYYDVDAVFDDRDQTVRMWRDMGCTTFQVADGDF